VGGVPALEAGNGNLKPTPNTIPTCASLPWMTKVWLLSASAGPAPTSKTWWCILGLNGEVWAALLLHVFKVFQQRREGFVDLKVLEDNLRAQRLYESVGMFVVRREPVPA
jgi:hypothetical protein